MTTQIIYDLSRILIPIGPKWKDEWMNYIQLPDEARIQKSNIMVTLTVNEWMNELSSQALIPT